MKIIDIVGDNYCGSFTRIHKGCRAVIIKDGKMLLSYETVNDQWMLPGGTLEENETEEECVIRELCEETGYIIKPTGCALEIDEYYEDCKWVNLYFTGEITGTTERRLT
ncbi:MAG: NUDIX domain-containing protein, partial [Oscillospiraceae bacterium]|nr:NUDIX domain-containing protein [Oscillospiraceae bacterium]